MRKALKGLVPDFLLDAPKIPGWVGSDAAARGGGSPFSPFKESDKGTLRARMRAAAQELLGGVDLKGWDVQTPEELYLFKLFKRFYKSMAGQAQFYKDQQDDPFTTIFYPPIIAPDKGWVPWDAMIATKNGLVRAIKFFRNLNVMGKKRPCCIPKNGHEGSRPK
ncbi:MAG: hypothetical protein P4M13_01745 [Alphaproteobacteria bacterium]|nr:hypothetical protein [Alphaproteobacteria bacterium]